MKLFKIYASDFNWGDPFTDIKTVICFKLYRKSCSCNRKLFLKLTVHVKDPSLIYKLSLISKEFEKQNESF